MLDHLRDLARALRLQDHAAADEALDLIARDRGDTYADAIAAGRRDAAARGRVSALPPVRALPLPLPGASFPSWLGDDPAERVGGGSPRKRAA